MTPGLCLIPPLLLLFAMETCAMELAKIQLGCWAVLGPPPCLLCFRWKGVCLGPQAARSVLISNLPQQQAELVRTLGCKWQKPTLTAFSPTENLLAHLTEKSKERIQIPMQPDLGVHQGWALLLLAVFDLSLAYFSQSFSLRAAPSPFYNFSSQSQKKKDLFSIPESIYQVAWRALNWLCCGHLPIPEPTAGARGVGCSHWPGVVICLPCSWRWLCWSRPTTTMSFSQEREVLYLEKGILARPK